MIKKLYKILKVGPLFFVFIKLIDTFNSSSKSSGGTSSNNSDINDPSDLPKASWKQALKRTKQALKDKDLAVSAAALSYYTTLSFFPVVLGLASFYVVITSPHSLLSLIHQLHKALPESLYVILNRQLTPIANSSSHKAWVGAIVSLVALLWTTSGGLQNLIKATNKAYEVKETRKFYKVRAVSLLLSIVVLVLGSVILAMLLMQSNALTQLGAPHWMAMLFPILRWPILIVLISFVLSTIYRYAPNRNEPHWAWVSWGATAAAIIWLAASVVFFIYVQDFGNYTKTYGTFAGIIVLMIWFNISSLIVVLGAQVNKKLEEVAPPQTTD